ANLASAEEGVRLARKAVADAVVVSPISGRVDGRPAQVGAVLGPGSPVARIVGLNTLYFEAEIPEVEIGKAQPGARVQVTVEAAQGLSLTGTVRTVSPVASNVARLYRVRVALEEAPALLKPGMFAQGRLVTGRQDGVFRVPGAAVQRDGEIGRIMVADPSDKALARRVRVIRDSGSDALVTGLKPGDRVIVAGQAGLLEGSELRIDEGAPASGSPAE
ncbi:MAG: efflux RND transporter periplasmic adaptor subunit, partial [Fimbriimonadaceae bacterium]|nr:efflux RND transporter periplasmic adaptor subunit [Fimbriimonadaceae bacterium]